MFMGDIISAKPLFEKVLEFMPDLKTQEQYREFWPYFEAVGL